MSITFSRNQGQTVYDAACQRYTIAIFALLIVVIRNFFHCSFIFISAMIQQPRVPSSGLMPASDVLIRAKEVSSCASSKLTGFH